MMRMDICRHCLVYMTRVECSLKNHSNKTANCCKDGEKGYDCKLCGMNKYTPKSSLAYHYKCSVCDQHFCVIHFIQHLHFNLKGSENADGYKVNCVSHTFLFDHYPVNMPIHQMRRHLSYKIISLKTDEIFPQLPQNNKFTEFITQKPIVGFSIR